MQRFLKSREVRGYEEYVGSDSMLDYLAFGKLVLSSGQSHHAETGDYETALVLMSGQAAVETKDKQWSGLGGRKHVFDGKATAVYLPCRSEYTVTAETDLEVAVCRVKAEETFEPFVVAPEDIVVNQRGKDTWKREVHDILADHAEGRVHRIVLGETFNEAGMWSSFPPHKHDGEHAPEEADMEEIYHYQLEPAQGFGVQLHYTKDGSIDDAYIIRHGDVFAIDKGYHPVAAAGGYRLYYLWFMAGGSGRKLTPYDDPDHRWMK